MAREIGSCRGDGYTGKVGYSNRGNEFPTAYPGIEFTRALLDLSVCSIKNLNNDMLHWAGGPIAVIDAFGILNDTQIRRYFELGCEVKALGRGHLARLKREVREK